MRKLTHNQAVIGLNSILVEAEACANSGDARLAASGRNTLILANILLTIISAVPKEEYNKIPFLGQKAASNLDDDGSEDASDTKGE